jgi:hypothetical protein
MATKLTVPRPAVSEKIQQDTIPDADVIEDNTEPSPPPVVVVVAAPEPPPSRPIVASLPSQYELESERKSSPPVLERRKHLTTLVASTVGVAWFICIVAMGQSAMRAMLFH